jgi:hypothetical protein
MQFEDLWPYDIETYPNVFTMYVGNYGKRKCWKIEISDRVDDREKFFNIIKKIRKQGGYMVGYNNLGFDYPIIHFMLKNPEFTVYEVYEKAQAIIDDQNDDEKKFSHLIPSWKRIVPQLDLLKIHHFDNKAKATSLKMLEFNMRSDNIEDLPYQPGTYLDENQIGFLLPYNKHDMSETDSFLGHTMGKIEFRENLSEKYEKDFMNHNDTKIGKDYFIMRLEEETPGSCFKKVDGKNKPNQTWRKSIDLESCIFDYIEFERPEFDEVLEWLKKQEIKETKGVFTDIKEHELGGLAKYAKLRKKRQKLKGEPSDKDIKKYKKENPSCFIEEDHLKSGKISYYLCWNVADNLNTVIDDFEYDFGTGGIHGSIESTIVRSEDGRVIVDQDVASYYPNLCISNKIYPEHLGEDFYEIYQDVYNQRKEWPKGTDENAMLKLALNGVFGDSNSPYSPFYDPKFTMMITLNGQLSLCMLAEMLLKIPTLEMIQVNTDGLTYKVNEEYKESAQKVCHKWENITGLELEAGDYELMAIRDVNNYLAKGTDGKIKRKGSYTHKLPWEDGAELDWHQNHSALIIPKAAEAALLEDEDISYFIRNHSNKYDFMLRTKVPRSSRLVVTDSEGDDTQVQNITRYYVSNEGDGQLVKIMPPLPTPKPAKKWVNIETGEEWLTTTKAEETKAQKKGFAFECDTELPREERRIGIETGWEVKVCNDMKNFDWDINYDYYIREARKLVDPLLGDNQ